jgi:hypothetical protein
MNICVILEQGWILVGQRTESTESQDTMALCNASVVRSWHNGKGIGGIAKAENRDEYTLDAIGDVIIRQNKILFEIPCEW